MTSGGVEGTQAVEIFLLEAAHLRKGIIVLKASYSWQVQGYPTISFHMHENPCVSFIERCKTC